MQYLQGKSRFYVLGAEGGPEIAEMTFTRMGSDKATLDHTFVDNNYRGQGIAEHLLALVVEKMQQEERELIPVCSYAVKKLSSKKN